MWKRFLIELGTGADLHGMDVMEAATRAVKDAVSHCCMCGLVETLGIQDLKKDMRISLKIAAPDPAGVDPEALKKLLIADDVDVEVVQGGMLQNGLHVDEFGNGDQIVVVNAGITVYVRT
ncbi:MAG: Lin0512 family protein [Oscillospiraceae bacterium]|nr:Lin0512 family protein [Oscillospiraceae bacterium]